MEQVLERIGEDMCCVDRIIQQQLHSEVGLIDELSHHIVDSGGKRLRPALLLFSAGVFSGDIGWRHHQLAAIIELIHTATLLHDDVVDASLLRRGQATANQCWGNEASVLVGDFLYSRAFQMMVEVGSMRVMGILADTTNTIAGGEVEQLLLNHSTEVTEQSCLNVIGRKTASLFRAAAQLGAVISNQDEASEQTIADYGEHFGMAFQLMDDVMDYSMSPDDSGKTLYEDLLEGKPTIPLLYAISHSELPERDTIREMLGEQGQSGIDAVLETVRSTGAIEYTCGLAREQVERGCAALSRLPVSPFRDTLYELAYFIVSHDY